jgi:fructose-bisphosphate aldolase class II
VLSPLVSTRELFQDTEDRGYALGAFNTVNLEMSRAIHIAAVEESSPFIMAATSGAIKYAGADNIACTARNLNAEYGTMNALHLDHGPDLETALLCKNAGFTSIMYDSSSFPLEENIRLTREVRDALGEHGLPLEGELGRLAGAEDDISVTEREAFLTDPDEAVRFVEETGVNSLAISIGNQHGLYKGEPKLDFGRLEEIKRRISIPIVLHGSSGLSDDNLARAVELGVRKINFDTDLRHAFREGFEGYLKENPNDYDIRRYLNAAIRQVADVVKHKMRVIGSSGKTG